MRGLIKAAAAAALLPLSTLALAQTHHQETSDLHRAAAFVTLEISDFHEDLSHNHLQTLRIDVLQSDSDCDASKVQLFRQLLPSKPYGRGNGHFETGRDSSVSASWAFTCLPSLDGSIAPTFLLELTVTGINGHTVPETTLAVRIKQSDPIAFISFDSPALVAGLAPFIKPCGSSELKTLRPSVDWEQITLEELEMWLPGHPMPVTADQCSSWRCAIDSMKASVKEKAGHLYHDMMTKKIQWPGHSENKPHDALRPSTTVYETVASEKPSTTDDSHQVDAKIPDGDSEHDKSQILMKPVGSPNMQPISFQEDGYRKPRVSATPTPTASSLSAIPPPEQSLVMTLSIAATAFALFSLLSVIFVCRRHLSPHIQRCRRETREERLARVYVRRRAVGRFFQNLFCGLFGLDEKMDGEHSSPPQGRDPQPSNGGGGLEEEDTTMEQELASFSEAANMVSGLIAAEEGRNHTARLPLRQQQRWQRPSPPSVPESVQALYPGYVPGNATPPSYENDTADASMVADGFRYAPGGRNYTAGSPVGGGDTRGNSGSDRLGYGNKG